MATTAEKGFDRDAMARWYSTRHMKADTGVKSVYYLPSGAPPTEIRLLEVNDLIAETPPQAIDFGVDVDGADAHTLYVLDVTPAQWEAVRSGTLPLPTGWTLADSIHFARK